MLVNKRIQVGVRVVAAVVAIAILGMPTVHAASAAEKSNSANTLKISPVRSDIEIKAGAAQTVKVGVTNLTDAPITVRPI